MIISIVSISIAISILYFRNGIFQLFKKLPPYVLDMFWYLFIVVFIGQLGPIIGYAETFWFDGDVLSEIKKSAGKADLITCATAILAGATFFLVKEYNSSDAINDRKTKSVLILASAIIGLLCIGVTAELLAQQKFIGDKQETIHWILYGLALLTAFFLWLYEEFQGTAAEEVKKVADQADKMTQQAKEKNKINGVKV